MRSLPYVGSDNGTGYYPLMVKYIAGNLSAEAIRSGGTAAESYLAMGEAAMVAPKRDLSHKQVSDQPRLAGQM